MGASKNFYTSLREKEQYANVSLRLDLYYQIVANCEVEYDYTMNHIKEVNPIYNQDELLCELYKQRSKISKEIIKREQELNKQF